MSHFHSRNTPVRSKRLDMIDFKLNSREEVEKSETILVKIAVLKKMNGQSYRCVLIILTEHFN